MRPVGRGGGRCLLLPRVRARPAGPPQVASEEGCGGSGGQRGACSVQGWGGISAAAPALPCW
uniref:Uncharacterized protein n=1 Tax=Arundo donax TaxID=35708 RepID=A0A0A9DWV4_ARUDO